jgi:hypothetical protein
MTKVMTAVTDYENKALQTLNRVQDEILTYLKQAVAYVDERTSAVELPFEVPELTVLDELPTLSELVDTQFAFSKKVLANQEKFAKNVVKAVKPLTREASKPKARTTAKAA